MLQKTLEVQTRSTHARTYTHARGRAHTHTHTELSSLSSAPELQIWKIKLLSSRQVF